MNGFGVVAGIIRVQGRSSEPVEVPRGAPDGYPGGTPVEQLPGVPPTKRLVACGWCYSTHIADVTCTCKEPCAQGWCPAGVELEKPL